MTAVLTAASVTRRLLVTPVRVVTSAALSLVFLLIAVVSNLNDELVVEELVLGGLLLFVVPIVSLVFAVGALGDANDDGTLVYLWLKPLPRWQLGLAALLATWTFVVPACTALGALLALVGGDPDRALSAAVSCGLAALAYSSVFVGLGLRTTRSILSGMAYVLIWEGFLAGLSDGLATVSVRRWSSALFIDLGGPVPGAEVPEASTLAAVIVLTVVTCAGLALTTHWLTTRDVP